LKVSVTFLGLSFLLSNVNAITEAFLMLSNIQNRLQHGWREESIWNLLHHRLLVKKNPEK